MVSSSLVLATAHLQAHMSLEHCGHPRLLQSRSTDMVTAIAFAIVVMMDLIWQSLRRLIDYSVYVFCSLVVIDVNYQLAAFVSFLLCCGL